MENDRKPPQRRQGRADEREKKPASRGNEHTQPNSGDPNKPASHEKRHPLEWANFWLLVGVFVATAAAAYFNGKQAGIAGKQLGIAGDTEIRQLRAYVGVIPGDVTNFGDQEKQSFRLVRKNFGLTPAYNLWIDFRQDVIRIGATVPLVPNNPPAITGLTTLFPTMELRHDQNGSPLTRQQLELARIGTEFQMAYWGIVYYTNTFGGRHYTRYCWLYKGPSMTATDVDWCLGHNDSN